MSVTDAEKAFYQQALAEPEGLSIQDLRYAYFLAALDGSLPGTIPTPPGSGTFVLTSTDGVLSWEAA